MNMAGGPPHRTGTSIGVGVRLGSGVNMGVVVGVGVSVGVVVGEGGATAGPQLLIRKQRQQKKRLILRWWWDVGDFIAVSVEFGRRITQTLCFLQWNSIHLCSSAIRSGGPV
jgi:hypothetical protein